ncbi:MAG: hypothetical protein GY832_11240 [Chloroflexi bacterium]|nr:hypothetical protein [Chloroflexota bacterium]
MLSQIPIAVQRAIETIAYWENVEKEGGYVDGSFGNQKDYRAYHEFMKQASQKQRKIVKRLEQEVKSKLS